MWCATGHRRQLAQGLHTREFTDATGLPVRSPPSLPPHAGRLALAELAILVAKLGSECGAHIPVLVLDAKRQLTFLERAKPLVIHVPRVYRC